MRRRKSRASRRNLHRSRARTSPPSPTTKERRRVTQSRRPATLKQRAGARFHVERNNTIGTTRCFKTAMHGQTAAEDVQRIARLAATQRELRAELANERTVRASHFARRRLAFDSQRGVELVAWSSRRRERFWRSFCR